MIKSNPKKCRLQILVRYLDTKREREREIMFSTYITEMETLEEPKVSDPEKEIPQDGVV